MNRKKRKSLLSPEWHAVNNAIPDLHPCDEYNWDVTIDKFTAHLDTGCQQRVEFYARNEAGDD